MKCDRCSAAVQEGEEREHHGEILCEDCYMDVLSPAKACDPWAVHSAKSFGVCVTGYKACFSKIIPHGRKTVLGHP